MKSWLNSLLFYFLSWYKIFYMLETFPLISFMLVKYSWKFVTFLNSFIHTWNTFFGTCAVHPQQNKAFPSLFTFFRDTFFTLNFIWRRKTILSLAEMIHCFCLFPFSLHTISLIVRLSIYTFLITKEMWIFCISKSAQTFLFFFQFLSLIEL